MLLLADDAISHLVLREYQQACLVVGEIKGFLEASQSRQLEYELRAELWVDVKKAYEAGDKPSEIALKHGVSAKAITDRAYREQWLNPRKVSQLMTRKRKKPWFYRTCGVCEQEFASHRSNDSVCNQCLAFQHRKTAEEAV